MAVRVNEPPDALDLLDPEEPGRLCLCRGEAAILVPVRKARGLRERVGFGRPRGLEIGFGVRLARPLGVRVLAEVVNQRLAFENVVAGIGFREGY